MIKEDLPDDDEEEERRTRRTRRRDGKMRETLGSDEVMICS